ncbi:MAG: hypothetical protein ABJD68_13215 [Nakamurella sp.]
MVTKPMVAVSVWGGAHDGARFQIPRRNIREAGLLRFSGDFFTFGYDNRIGWTAIYTADRTSDR